VELYARIRRAVRVEGRSQRAVAREFGLYRRGQLRITASGDKDVGAFLHKFLCRRKPDTAGAAGNECNFSLKSGQSFLLCWDVRIDESDEAWRRRTSARSRAPLPGFGILHDPSRIVPRRILVTVPGRPANMKVSSSGHRLYEDGILRIILQDLANLPDCGIDAVVRIKENILTPDLGDNVISADQLRVALNQQDQYFHGDSFQLQRPAGTTQFKAGPV